ncbi:MAG TPA: PTS sugar transporter subunit IIA [Pirellulales bacterium]|jgi:PTS system nitrogen regulatory IIA component|nr:PTS sugar transporter subunit IIA [Pirellulales bacterium]
MSDEDFDLPSLAEYLHLSAAQLARLAERGQLPGRKIAGQWRFSRPEITFWLEQRIGLAEPADLARMEDALERANRTDGGGAASIGELLPESAIAIPLAARTKSSVIEAMAEFAAGTGWLWDPRRMAEGVRFREQLCSTALDSGVALMHPRRPLPDILDRPFIALGRTSGGIPFGHAHGALTDIFFLLCSTTDRGHLHTLARLSRLVGDPAFLAELRSADDAAEAHRALLAREQALPR